MTDSISLQSFRNVGGLELSRVGIAADGQSLEKSSLWGRNAAHLSVRTSFKEALSRHFGAEAVKLAGFDATCRKPLSSREIRKTINKLENLRPEQIRRANIATLCSQLRAIRESPDSGIDSKQLSLASRRDFLNQAVKKHPEISSALFESGDTKALLAMTSIIQEVLAKSTAQPSANSGTGVELLNTTPQFYNAEDRASPAQQSRIRNYDPGVHGERLTAPSAGESQLGLFNFKKIKDKGVEPGFDGTLRWNNLHDAALKRAGSSLNAAAQQVSLALLNDPAHVPEGLSPEEADTLRTALLEAGGPGVQNRVAGGAAQNNAPALQELQTRLLEQKPELASLYAKTLTHTLPMFNVIHHVKMDYAESDISHGKVHIPLSKAKGGNSSLKMAQDITRHLHRHFTGKSRESANMGAIKETLATDLMHAMGITAQKARLIPATYRDGSLKLMVSSEHMQSAAGSFSDFGGKLSSTRNAVLTTTDPATGKRISDPVVENWGRNKILMLLLADRDAIGSRGDNKGRMGDTFAAIDPGHSLEGYMSFRNLHDDFSFDQPRARAAMQFKNFTIFDDSSYIEKMRGVENIETMRASGEDMRVFDGYVSYFTQLRDAPDTEPAMRQEYQAYIDDIESKRSAFIDRRDYILDEVFKERLTVYHDRPELTEAADKLEKLIAPSTDRAPDGSDVQMRHLRLESQSKRNPVHLEKTDTGYTLSFKGNLHTLERVSSFLSSRPEGADGRFQPVLNRGTLTLALDGESIAAFASALDEAHVKDFVKAHPL